MESEINGREKRRSIFLGIGGLVALAGIVLFIIFRQQPCPTDLNADKKTDSIDLEILKKVFNKKVPENIEELVKYDFNQDSLINASDLGILISQYGKKCK